MRYFFNIKFSTPGWFDFIQLNGGILFVILSGICVTLGHHNIIRGLIVAAASVVVTVATLIMGDKDVFILFGVLHLLAFCMLTYSLYRRLPWPVILAMGLCFIVLGYYFETINVDFPYLFMFGLTEKNFTYGDFFPIFPYLGWFMTGVAAGMTLYKNKETLFKKVNPDFFIIRFFSFCGRHSLIIYLLHPVVVFAAFYGINFVKSLFTVS